MPLKLSESTNILFIRIIYSIRIPYILWNDGLLSTLILFLEIFRSHAELFQKQFAEIRRRINTHHITDISNPIFTFLNIFRRFLEPDQTDKVKWGKIKYRFNFFSTNWNDSYKEYPPFSPLRNYHRLYCPQ